MTNLTKAEELKLQFDQLTSYEDRINFCLENLHPGPCLNTAPGVAAYLFHNEVNEDVRSCTSSSLPFHPEALKNWPVIISTMPQTSEEWQLNNKLFYEYLETAWFTSEGAKQIEKSFLQRKQEFEKRIVNTVDSEEILKEEILTVFNTYEQPANQIDESNIHFNLQVKRFRERRRGHLSQFPAKQDKWFEEFLSLHKIIEADHAYQYYKYLRELEQNPNWLKDLEKKLRTETRFTLDINFGESYDSQYFNGEIKEHGYITIGTPNRVYSGPLAAFLFAQAVNVKEQFTQIPKTIRGRDYMDSYRIGYERGAFWFKENYSLTTDTLYGPNAKAYIANIHDLCFHLNCGTWPAGLLSWKGKYPLLITDRIIEEHGYYAGIIAQVEELTAKHPRLFENWKECHYDNQAEPSQPVQQPKAVDISVEVSDPSDPAKMQRAVTSLVHQFQVSKGNSAPYKHPFLWHTKFRHEISSPYVLEVNKDQDITDESGKIVDRIKVSLTDKDVDEAFIHYLITCHTNNIAPFLSFQFDKYYNGLLANQSPQPFFNFIILLAEKVNAEGLLYKAESDILINWIITHPHYQHSTKTDIVEQSVNDETQKSGASVPISLTPSANHESLTFNDFLTDERKDKTIEILVAKYTDRKARFIAYMLFALSDLGLINNSTFDDKTKLHTALTKTFGKIGSRTALNEALIRLNSPSKKHRAEMQEHKTQIAAMLKC